MFLREPERLTELITLAMKVYVRTLRKHAQLYAGVEETLNWLQFAGAHVAVASNAPFFAVRSKLSRLRLLPFVNSIHCWRGATESIA